MNGVTLMVLASASFSLMSAFVKALGKGFPFAEVALFRALFGLPPVLLLIRRKKLSPKLNRPWLMLARGSLGFVTMLTTFYSLQRGKLAEITVVSRTQPIFVSLLAPLLLAERATGGVYVALLAGVVGTIMVVKPTPELINMPAAVRFGGSFTSALAHLAVRRLNATHQPEVIVLYFNLITLVGSTATALPHFVTPSATEWLLLMGVACFATIGQLLMTNAYRRDAAPVVSASSYSSVGFSLIIGYVFWSELPDTLALIGGLVVVIAGTALAYGQRLNVPGDEEV